MFARTRRQPAASDEALTLRSLSGKTICEFSGETVANIRRMLTSLMYQATMPKSIANVAALRGEGVSYITLAMAATLASDVSARVCAVELNWWHPSLHLYLAGQQPAPAVKAKGKAAKGAPAEPASPGPEEGLGAVLRGAATLDQALVGTSLANLALLPAGHVPAEARSALARSAQLKATVEALAEQFDYLIFDVPAVSATSDTVALTSLASSVAVVVRQGVTPVNTVKGALDEVKHVPVLGVILNQVQVYTPRWLLNLLPQE
ncbi:MAG TPA: CpsD/CapB family tyrosine-protein kinase [Chloroflexaceae bacterium]|nr:CpsD/CapB family tyrosine-protein kinase [Chloroflexaceae bacterium]